MSTFRILILDDDAKFANWSSVPHTSRQLFEILKIDPTDPRGLAILGK